MGSAMGGALSTTILAQMASQEPVDAAVFTEGQKVIGTNRNDQLTNAEPPQQVIDISEHKDDHKSSGEGATTPPSPLPLTVSPLPKKISPKKAPRQSRSAKGRTANVPASPSNESDPFA